MIEFVNATNHTATLRCNACGKPFNVDMPEDAELFEMARQTYDKMICADCERAAAAKAEADAAARAAGEWRRKLPELIAAAKIPDGYRLDRATGAELVEPPVRLVAEWLWRHRAENVLLSGQTGTGKSTSACFVAVRLIADHRRVAYCKLRQLLARWCAVKRSEHAYAAEAFWGSLGMLDLLIIDEVIGKAKVTDSGKEFLFELLDGAYNLERHTRIWLLGEFYAGSLEEMLANSDSAIRRLRESFTLARIADGKISKIEL